MSVKPEYEIKRRCDVCTDEEWRYEADGEWYDHPAEPTASQAWVEVRPRQQRDPKWITDDRDGSWPDGIIITTVGEMRDRTDLDRWEWACPDVGWWVSMDGYLLGKHEGDFPVIVRRRS